MVTKSKNKTRSRTQNKTENNQNMKKTEHNELLSFLRVFDVLVQYCLTSWSSPAPRRLWRQKNFNCSPGLSFLLMYRSNRSFDVLPRTNPWVFELLNIGLCKSPPPPRGKIVQMPHPPNFFVKGKFDNRDFLLLDQISAGKTWHFRFKLPTPVRQRFKFPSPWARTTVKCQWVAREMMRWEIVFNCF